MPPGFSRESQGEESCRNAIGGCRLRCLERARWRSRKRGGQGGSELAFSKAKILVEFKASAEDAGVQVLLDSVRLVFKDLPLDTACNDRLSQQLHPFACRAALLARCAGERSLALLAGS